MISQNIAEMNTETSDTSPQAATGSSRIIIWLIALSLGILFVPLYLVSSAIQEQTEPLRHQLATLEAQLTATPAPNAEEERLRAELLTLNQQIRALEVVTTELAASQINWPEIMAVIADYDPALMQITELTQTESQLSLSGRANVESVVTAYADFLRDSEYFTHVAVQSLRLMTLPTATPVRRGEPTPAPVEPVNSRVVEFVVVITLRMGSDGQPG